ncbi:hypothetical protein H112_08891 [Trichophyton rubrum D6]|uniref:Uncharacterized protein n=2 Tax=Trichophyton TaxID=5550 RepID=A0A022VMP8_TRIRU|nr:hypothetical protein H100_08913 [Trichophyton rubrum MR850]EZF36602.1 hypothetical protein H102_08873 [Trichophyton rubrum CBS 100081]EZF47246.1 hypothetical protein H103_08893 [Trichophyton rubrum CBS 288.86]EZF57905.1 hypothetical protein H104_08844 [Trichophyton rubrum CBS 289.86]EZF68568.1 hypothetical protein H105_08899 [Trichophyton soudanense CBS 452.61]EZF79073.1 hypothetical protein H110_08896 [Trichophyton rubrum MR1448]EZF89878.1 hypothetical protein H113_08961 [Trichophyton rub
MALGRKAYGGFGSCVCGVNPQIPFGIANTAILNREFGRLRSCVSTSMSVSIPGDAPLQLVDTMRRDGMRYNAILCDENQVVVQMRDPNLSPPRVNICIRQINVCSRCQECSNGGLKHPPRPEMGPQRTEDSISVLDEG